jgi:1-acyl-sn-glycerol-3-phosphate acyltransferase
MLEIFCHFEIRGQEHCRELRGPLIVTSNHPHQLDSYVLSAAMPFRNRIFPIRFLAYAHYVAMPILGTIIRVYGVISVTPGAGIEKSLAAPLRVLEERGVVGMFPEGHLEKKEGEFLGAKPGLAYLALKSGALILPIAVRGHIGLNFWNFILCRKHITVAFGKTFRIQELAPSLNLGSSKEEMTKVSQSILDRVKEIYQSK